jgi:hypothetical protein
VPERIRSTCVIALVSATTNFLVGMSDWVSVNSKALW